MSGLDAEWAQQQLREFVRLTDQVGYAQTPGVFIAGTHYRGGDAEIAGLAHVVEQILDRVLPRWRQEVPSASGSPSKRRWSSLRELAARALEQLRRQDELRARLGDNAPQLDAGRLHPWVWEAARSLWGSQHYAEAVQAAAVRVNAETQRMVDRRDVSEVTLFQQTFSEDPPAAGKPRLQVIPDDGSRSVGSRQRGARALGEALYAGLRNPAAHDGDELEEHAALEQLAAFSLLARWIAGSTLRTSTDN